MRSLIQILFLFLAWCNLSAAPVLPNVALPSYAISISNAENLNQESKIKTGVLNYAKSDISKNSLSQKVVFGESSVLENRAREANVRVVQGAGSSLIASIKSRLTLLKNPARPILSGEGIPLINGKQTRVFGGSKFDNVVTGSYGDASKKYIWTIDDNGVNVGLEQTPIGGNSVIKHTNLSSQAYSGGEVWFITQNKVHVNAWSGRFGAGANMTKAEWEASIDAFKSNGYEVIVEPYNP